MKKNALSNLLLFASIGCVALGVGFLRSFKPVVKEANAANPEIEVNDNIVEVGKYPQSVVKSTTDLYDDIVDSIEGDPIVGKTYEYKGEKYRYYPAVHSTESGGKYEDGTGVKDGPAFYKIEPIKWHLYDKDTANNKAYLYAVYIMDVKVFQQNIEVDGTNQGHVSGKPDVAANDWQESTMREFLNGDFCADSFSENERNFILENSTKANSSGVKVKDKVTLMTAEDYSANKDKAKFETKASDYAKGRTLSYHFHSYDWSFFWLNSKKADYDTLHVQYVRGTEVGGGGFSQAASTEHFGVRPLIVLDLTKVTIGKTSQEKASDDAKSAENANTAALVIGIIFSILGMAGLITFFTLMKKGILTSKMSPKIILTVLASVLVVTSIGVVSLSVRASRESGGGGGSCTLKYGYYVQSTAQYEDPDNNMVQVGYVCWLIKSDGTARHNASLEDTKNASDFDKYADNLQCTWEQTGCTLKITYTGFYSGVAIMTVKGDGKLYSGSKEVFHWVRGE